MNQRSSLYLAGFIFIDLVCMFWFDLIYIYIHTPTHTHTYNMYIYIYHSKKCSTVIKLFKQTKYYILSTTEKVLIGKSNGKSLSNCNSNCQGQPFGWNSWLFHPCTVCTYREPKLRKLDKKRHPPIPTSIWLSISNSTHLFGGLHVWKTRLSTCRRHHGMPCLSHLNDRYEQSNNQYINHRHRYSYCINC